MGKPNSLQQVRGMIGAGIGIVFSRLLGPAALVPFLGVVLLLAGLGAWRKRRGEELGAKDVVIGLLGGHMAWMIVGGLFLGDLSTVAIDLVVMGALVALVAKVRHGLVYAATIGVSALAAAYTAVVLHDAAGLDLQSGAMHLVLRVGVVVAAVIAWRALARERAAEQPAFARPGGPSAPVA